MCARSKDAGASMDDGQGQAVRGAPVAHVCVRWRCRDICEQVKSMVRCGLGFLRVRGKVDAADSSEGLLGVSALVDEQWMQLITAQGDFAASALVDRSMVALFCGTGRGGGPSVHQIVLRVDPCKLAEGQGARGSG